MKNNCILYDIKYNKYQLTINFYLPYIVYSVFILPLYPVFAKYFEI